MSAEQTVPTLDPAHALRPSLLTSSRQRQPIFWLSLFAAALVHAALIAGLSRSGPRPLGDAGGDTRAINVELVDAGTLRGMSEREHPVPPAAPPQQPAAQAAPPPQEEAAQEPAPEKPDVKTETPPAEQAAALPAFEGEQPKAAPPHKPAPAKKSAESQSPAKKESQPKKERASKPAQKTALKPPSKLDLSVPFDVTMQAAAGGAGASSATRPAGITRSGANDRFGRDVIRALKKTMPPSEGVTGKVKVRIFLNERGNVAWVRVINSSGDRLLDDSVVFSVRQSIFPFPPKGSTDADRTFLVTYIYR